MPKIVFDRFHVVKLNNQYPGMLRRQLMSTKTYADSEVIKGARFLLLKNPDNLDKAKNDD
jgi:transposase